MVFGDTHWKPVRWFWLTIDVGSSKPAGQPLTENILLSNCYFVRLELPVLELPAAAKHISLKLPGTLQEKHKPNICFSIWNLEEISWGETLTGSDNIYTKYYSVIIHEKCAAYHRHVTSMLPPPYFEYWNLSSWWQKRGRISYETCWPQDYWEIRSIKVKYWLNAYKWLSSTALLLSAAGFLITGVSLPW